jgi:hypothetical protein
MKYAVVVVTLASAGRYGSFLSTYFIFLFLCVTTFSYILAKLIFYILETMA